MIAHARLDFVEGYQVTRNLVERSTHIWSFVTLLQNLSNVTPNKHGNVTRKFYSVKL